MVNEDLKVNPATKKYIITFKKKDQRLNKRDDKMEILKTLTGLGDFENYVDVSNLRIGDKFHRYNKTTSTGRNSSDRFNPITPNTETVHDINRYDLPVVMMKLTPEQHKAVRKDPNVLMVEEDSVIYPQMSTGGGAQQIPYGITRVKAPESWVSASNRRGEGVTVAVIDSGVDSSHPDLQGNFTSGVTFAPNTVDWFDEGVHIGTTASPIYYHGTHVAGTICAVDNQEGVVGVAPRVELFPVRIFSKEAVTTTTSIVMAGMEWVITNQLEITNQSIGGFAFLAAAQTQYQQAYDAGIISCCAAGNAAVKTMDPNNPASKQNYPSGYTANIEVSSIGPTDIISTFSNYGTKTEFAAPGELILSTWLPTIFGGYNAISGTSQATPHVSGMFAMGISNWRFSPCSDMYNSSTKKNDVLRTVAHQTADKLGKFSDRDPANAYGYGIINVDAFVKKLLNPDIHVQNVA